MNGLKKILCLMLTFALVPGLAACGGSGSGSTGGASEVETEEASTEETADTTADDEADASDFDLTANLTRTDADDGSSTLESDLFSLTLPDGDTWDYEVISPEEISIYNIAAKKGDFGGNLLSIEAFEPDDDSYDVMPSAVLGEVDGKKVVAVFTSDIQYDLTDKAATNEYKRVYDVIQTISDDPSTSPMVLK